MSQKPILTNKLGFKLAGRVYHVLCANHIECQLVRHKVRKSFYEIERPLPGGIDEWKVFVHEDYFQFAQKIIRERNDAVADTY